jgi:phosphoribosylformylglycinamidine synthase
MALVNCLNFGNPEHPEVMWQLSESIDGMAEACRALNIPVIGGNVSLYNESGGADIEPTPVVAVLGLIDDLVRRPPGVTLADGGELLMLGAPSNDGSTGGIDYGAHADLLGVVADLVNHGPVDGIHDVADGGVGVALAEMAVQAGIGWRVGNMSAAALQDESPSRVILCTHDADAVRRRAGRIPVTTLGRAGGDRLVVEGLVDIGLGDAIAAWRGAIPDALAVGQ